MIPIDKDTRIKLKYTPEARHRVFCALNWDARTDSPTMGDRIQTIQGHNAETFDLDLACVVYNENKQAIDGVSGRADETVDNSGHIYHSGDDYDGIGDDDDEIISIELKNMPEDIHHIVLVAEVQSQHDFQQVPAANIRLADAYTNENQVQIALNGAESGGKSAYVFARIYRHGDTWMLHYIGDYLDGDEIEDWIDYLTRYLSF